MFTLNRVIVYVGTKGSSHIWQHSHGQSFRDIKMGKRVYVKPFDAGRIGNGQEYIHLLRYYLYDGTVILCLSLSEIYYLFIICSVV